MKPEFEHYLQERKLWQTAFDRLLDFGSKGHLEQELVQAKETFFAKLGRAHEMKEEIYENSSQSFLEWYLFNYPTKIFSKTPAVAFLTLAQGTGEDWSALENALFEHWSLYEVEKISDGEVILRDLLLRRTRKIFVDPESPEFKLWKIEKAEIIQARLFPSQKEEFYFLTHLWIHPRVEAPHLKKICRVRQRLWSRHQDFLLSTFEAAVRTQGLQQQIASSRSHNWMYQELVKRYA